MKINNLDNYEVAAINYPLMDPRIQVKDFETYFHYDYSNHDKFQVPVYIHVPFCSSICNFCIYSRQVPDSEGKLLARYVEALKREIELYSKTPYIQSIDIGSIFLGGGTPSCMSKKQIEEIITTLWNYLPLNKDIEITMECNTVSADEAKIDAMKRLGVTRISTGVQTFNNKYRELFEMRTTTKDIVQWIEMVQKYKFKEVSLDLLYGLPGQSTEEWKDDLKAALEMPIGHLSIYKLAVFAYTKLYKDISKQLVPDLPNNDIVLDMFMQASKLLKDSGFYLQSNQEYGREGTDAKFWKLTYDGYGDNLSFGAFSFGFMNGVNYQNLPNPEEYIKRLEDNVLPIKMVSKKINLEQAMERTLLLSCRGGSVDKKLFKEIYGTDITNVFSPEIDELKQQGLLEENEDSFYITDLGCFYQGNVSAKFMRSTFQNTSKMKKKMAIGMHIVPDAI